MKLSRFNIVIIIGFLAIVGVIIMQLFLINNAHKLAKKDTEDKIFFALQDVLEKLYKDNQTGLLVANQVEKISGNYFTVNVNYEFENTVFIDAGAVADKPGDLRPSVGIGTGIRWKSPIGPLQMDLAYGLKVKRLRLHISVGFVF